MSDVSLYIANDKHKGLSHAIDAQLDAEFQVKYGVADVKLSVEQWQSIFNLIQCDQAEQEEGQNSFSADDNNIMNGSHYQVVGGKNYIIKENVWNEIVKNVKGFLNIKETDAKATDTASTEVSTTVDAKVKTAEEIQEENKQKISNLISSSYQFEKLPKTLQNDLLRKYALMLDFAKVNNQTLDDDTISTRLKNYVKGWYYNGKEVMILKSAAGEDIKALKDKSPEDIKYEVYKDSDSDETKEKKINQLTRAYIEYYDLNGDGEIEIAESLYSDYFNEVKSPKDGISSAKAHQMAYKLYNDYKSGKLVPKENGTKEEQFLYGLIENFKYKDLTTSFINKNFGKTDYILGADDIRAFLETAMEANKNGKKGEIDGSEMIAMAKEIANLDDSDLYDSFLKNFEKILDSTPD